MHTMSRLALGAVALFFVAACSSADAPAPPTSTDPAVDQTPVEGVGTDEPTGGDESTSGGTDPNKETPGPGAEVPTEADPEPEDPVEPEDPTVDPGEEDPVDPEEPPPEAQEPQVCNDGSVCTDDTWDVAAGACVYTPVADATACNADDDGCTVDDACVAGVCTAGQPASCPVGDGPCAVATCTSDGPDIFTCGEALAAEGAACDDGAPCTVGDACDATGACVAGDLEPGCCAGVGDCDDGDPCTIDGCDGLKCTYESAADGTACDADADGCTVSDACFAGTCKAGAAATCPAPDQACLKAVCESTGAESFSCVETLAAAGSVCNDGQPCTVGDACDPDGACVPGSLVPDCCAADLDCDDGNPCTVDSCTASACTYASAPNGKACDADGDGCTVSDQCALGQCVAGDPIECQSPGECLIAACVSTGPTSFECQPTDAPAGTPCDDNLPCWAAACDGQGGCTTQPTAGCCDLDAECDDGNECTADTCHPDLLSCDNTNLAPTEPCDDGDACTSGDTCAQGSCASGDPVFCNDDDVCTTDSCNGLVGCEFTPLDGCSKLQRAGLACFTAASPGQQIDLTTLVTGGYGKKTYVIDSLDGGIAPPGTEIDGHMLKIAAVGVAGTFGFTVVIADVTGSVRVPVAVTAPLAGNETWTIGGVASPGPVVVPPGGGFTATAGVKGGQWVCSENLCEACSHLYFEHLSWVSQDAVGTTSDCKNKCGANSFCTGLGASGVCRPKTNDCGGCTPGSQCSQGICYATSLKVTTLAPTNPGAGFDVATDWAGQVILKPGWMPAPTSPMSGLSHYWLTFRMSFTVSAPVPCDPANPDLVAVRSVLISGDCQ